MLFVTDYRLKPNLTRSESKRLMEEFGRRGAAPGEVAHYVRIDGSGGVTITENESLADVFAYVLAFSEFMEFDVTPAMKIEDALAPLLTYVAEG